MGFDWEYLLNADGEDLQAAYDDLCWEAPDYHYTDDYWDDEPSIWSAPPDPVPEELRGTCAAGEIILAASAPFQACRLRLYHELAINGQLVHYLIAKDNTPLLAIILIDVNAVRYSENECCGVPLLRLPRASMEQGTPQEIISHLTSVLAAQREEPAPPQHSIDPIPVELHTRMARLHMIQQQNGHLWVPTAYGRSLGVLDGYLPPDEEGKYCHTLFISTQHKAQLDEALAFGQDHERPFRPKLSWEQTLLRASQGLPRNDGHAAGIAHAFASMPLTEYMASSPKELEILRGAFPLDDGATYQEAANHVFRVCMDSDGTHEYDERCMDLIFALTRPILAALSTTPRPAN